MKETKTMHHYTSDTGDLNPVHAVMVHVVTFLMCSDRKFSMFLQLVP